MENGIRRNNRSMKQTEYWIRPGQGKVIALIHGIGAKDPQDYWQTFLNVLAKDKQLQNYGLFIWKYPTHVEPAKWKDIARVPYKLCVRQLLHSDVLWSCMEHDISYPVSQLPRSHLSLSQYGRACFCQFLDH